MKVILAEKPSVARDIAKVLKINEKHDGYFSGNGYYITWAIGHLVQLSDPDSYDVKYKKWNLNDLPIIPTQFNTKLSSSRGLKKQFGVIKKLFLKSDVSEIVCATDAGREGELIFRFIYNRCNCKKKVKRLWISSQTDQAILKGFSNLKTSSLYDSLYDSAISRAESDWLVGMNCTRVYTIKHSSYENGVMSIGRVQTPVLRLIVERYHENVNFKPEIYYEILVEFEHINGQYIGKWFKDKTSRITDRSKAAQLLEQIKQTENGNIQRVNQKKRIEKPHLLYDLTELQKDANKRYRFSADKTLKIAQKLYETHKAITYPRTSSRYLTSDLKPKIKELLKNLQHINSYSPHISELLNKKLNFTSRIFNDNKVTDHHAIIPTEKRANIHKFSEDEKCVFGLITKRFISVFMDDCIKEITEILTGLNEYSFRSKGTVIRQQGWRILYPPKKSSYKNTLDDENSVNNQTLPIVKNNDSVINKKADQVERQTRAPKLYTEATLLGAMETAGRNSDDESIREAMKECGLGTPATRAQILERLLEVLYIKREKQHLVPTEKGIFLIKIMNQELSSPEMTGSWEKKLSQIRNGQYSRTQFMAEIGHFVQSLIQIVKQEESSKPPTMPGTQRFQKKRYTKRYNKKTPVKIVSTPNTSKGKIPDKNGIDKMVGENLKGFGNCPRCGGHIIEGKRGYGCSNWKSKNCKFVAWKTIAGKKLTDNQLQKLLKTGKTNLISGFISKQNKKFKAYLIIKDGSVGFEFK